MFGLFKKKSAVGILLVFMMFGCGKYTQPKLGESSSKIIVKKNIFTKSNLDKANTILKIDNQFAEPNENVILLKGEHKIDVLLAIFYKGKIKRAFLKDMNLDVADNDVYVINITTDKQTFTIGEESMAIFTIKNKNKNKFIVVKRVNLEDADIAQENENAKMVQDNIVYSAVVSVGL